MTKSIRNYRLRSRLLLVVSLLVSLVLAAGTSAVLIALTSRSAVLRAREMEVASRRAALLSVFAREQYIHEVDTIILRDHSHVGHHDQWVNKLEIELNKLRPLVDAQGARHLDAIANASCDLKCAFSEEILPAIDRRDWNRMSRAHHEANVLVDQMTQRADALAGYFDHNAVRAEDEAAGAIWKALVLAIVTGILAGVVALFSGQRLWYSFSKPLTSLERVAERVTAGDRTARVEPIEARELAVVARAFNRMLDALSNAESKLVVTERLAAIGRIAAGVAHEINNPIAVIRGYLSAMREDAHSETQQDELRILDEEAAHCQRIAEDLLMYARTPVLSMMPVDMAELLRDALDRADTIHSRRSISPESPPLLLDAESAKMNVDPLRIRQVIVNLVANAREAVSGNTPILVHGRAHDHGYRIEVLDRGPGIPNDNMAHIFEPFFTTKRNGTGLGLAVCYGLAVAHGGRIHAQSREGGGTKFIVDLPNSMTGTPHEECK